MKPRTSSVRRKLRTDLTVGEAVARGIIDNETLAYFLVRTRAFLLQLGIKNEWLRFRQHLKTEMAHYASDCWDAEIFCYTNRWEWWVLFLVSDFIQIRGARGVEGPHLTERDTEFNFTTTCMASGKD